MRHPSNNAVPDDGRGDPVVQEKVILLSSRDGSHTGPSGYSALARYLPASLFVEVHRQSPRNFVTRVCTAVNRRITLVRWAWGSSMRLEWMALRQLRRNPSRIVHYLWADRDMAYLDLLKKHLGFKIVGSFHNCPDQLESLFNFPQRLRAIDRFIVVSSCQVESLEKCGVPRSKISVVLHGVDTGHFRPDPQWRGDKFRVLSIGTWRRDMACMEEIFRRLGADGRIESVCLVQDKWRKRWAGIPNLRMPERMSDEELLQLFQSSHVLLMCAKAATANNALVEALACGLPVVGSDVGGIREYATETAGLFFPGGDASAAVGRILQLESARDQLSALGRGARARAEQLDWHNISRQTMDIYRSVGDVA